MTGFSATRILPVDTKREDWARNTARKVNDLLTRYSFCFFFTATPTSSETLCLHPLMADSFIPADWGGRIETISASPVQRYQAVEWSCDTPPAANWAMDIARKPLGSSSYTSIGTWTLGTGGALTAVTANNKVIPLTKGDVLKFTAPTIADGTIENATFTFIGER